MTNNKYRMTDVTGMASGKKLLLTALMGALAGNASADILLGETDDTRLYMYGLLDVGTLYQSKVSTDGDEKLGVETSGITPSILGFKATRTLRNNWTAFFNLETHFDMDSGMFHGSGDASQDADDGSGRTLFRRQSNIGLSSDWGMVIIGRQYGPGLLAHLATEPRAYKEQFSGVFTWAYSQLFNTINDADSGAGRNANNDVGIFFKNAIQYRNNIEGLDFGIMYSAGGQEDGHQEGNIWAVGVNYAFPALTLSGSYQVMKDQQTAETLVKHSSAGVAIPVSNITFKSNYMTTENTDSAGNSVLDLDSVSVGIDWKWGSFNSATLAYYINEASTPTFDSAETTTLVISNDYQLSDATTFYAQAAYVDTDDMDTVARFATSVVASPAPVDDQTTLMNLGLNFAF